jgi:hypothetical protein
LRLDELARSLAEGGGRERPDDVDPESDDYGLRRGRWWSSLIAASVQFNVRFVYRHRQEVPNKEIHERLGHTSSMANAFFHAL